MFLQILNLKNTAHFNKINRKLNIKIIKIGYEQSNKIQIKSGLKYMLGNGMNEALIMFGL